MEKIGIFAIIVAFVLGITSLTLWSQKGDLQFERDQYKSYFESHSLLLNREDACKQYRKDYVNDTDWYQSDYYIDWRNAQTNFERVKKETEDYYQYY